MGFSNTISCSLKYRKKDSIYADLFKYFGKKNREKNRLYFYKLWHNDVNAFRELNYTKNVNISSTASSSPNLPQDSAEMKNEKNPENKTSNLISGPEITSLNNIHEESMVNKYKRPLEISPTDNFSPPSIKNAEDSSMRQHDEISDEISKLFIGSIKIFSEIPRFVKRRILIT